jgi:hypothetical protein
VPRAHRDRPPYRLAITLAGCGVLATALAVILVGWVLDVAAVRSIIPGAASMQPHTAIALGLGAVAMLLLATPARGRRRAVGLALAGVPGLLALAVLFEYAFGVKLGIDEILFTDHVGRAAGIAYPGRLAPTTGVCFLLLTGALLSLDRGTSWRWRPSELFAIPMGIVALMSLTGYAYSIPAFYGPASAAKMAVNTSFCFVALATALLVARPRGRSSSWRPRRTRAGSWSGGWSRCASWFRSSSAGCICARSNGACSTSRSGPGGWPPRRSGDSWR